MSRTLWNEMHHFEEREEIFCSLFENERERERENEREIKRERERERERKRERERERERERQREGERGSNLRQQRLASRTAQVLVPQTTWLVQKNRLRDEI